MIYLRPVGRRQRRVSLSSRPAASVSEYRDAEGNVLSLRDRLSPGAVRKIAELERRPAASADDLWQRRAELLFERLVVGWTIAGLPLSGQQELLGRYRMANEETRRWIRQTIVAHVRERQPDVDV